MDTEQKKAIDTRLFLVSAKLLAISELIKFQGGEPSVEQERANLGLGEILYDLVTEVDKIKLAITNAGTGSKPDLAGSENRTD